MTSRRFRTAIEITAAVLVTLGLILWISGVFAEKVAPGVVAAGAPTVPDAAETAVVEEVTVPVIEEATGTVEAERKTLVSSRILAGITAVRVRAGEHVAAGDVLIELDRRELAARAAEAARTREGAAAARQKAESDLNRARSLLASRVISGSEFDQAEAAFKIADAAVKRTRDALEAAQVNLSYAEIRAPVAGRIVDRFADPGDTAVPGKPLLSLYDPEALRIEAPVRETLVSRLRVGDRVAVRLGTEGVPLESVVDEIVPQAEAGSRTFLVKVGLPRAPGIYTGMFGRVLIPAGEERRVVVPAAAVERIGQLEFVAVVDDRRQIRRRLVTLGAPSGNGRIEVLSGLRPGERVLLAQP